MGVFSAVAKRGAKLGGRIAAPRVGSLAPGRTQAFLDRVLDKAISGAGPFDAAADVATEALEDAGGSVDDAVEDLITSHTRLAGAQGFVTNLGGLVTAAVTIPANVAGLVMVQLRLHAAIAHLYGLDLDDDDVRAALLLTLLGTKETEKLVRDGDIPGNARWLVHRTRPEGPHGSSAKSNGGTDPEQSISQRVSAQVAATLVAALGGKQVAATVGKRIPFLGGVIGGFTDARATRRTGRDAAHALPRQG